MNNMNVDEIQKKSSPVFKKYRIKKAGLFGSYARRSDAKTSDIDILIELNTVPSLLEFIRIKLDLEKALNRKVDLVEYSTIKPLLKRHILQEEIRIYG